MYVNYLSPYWNFSDAKIPLSGNIVVTSTWRNHTLVKRACLNPFNATVLHSCPLKTSKKLWLSVAWLYFWNDITFIYPWYSVIDTRLAFVHLPRSKISRYFWQIYERKLEVRLNLKLAWIFPCRILGYSSRFVFTFAAPIFLVDDSLNKTIYLYFSGPNSLCRGLSNGNYVLRIFSTVYTNYYLTCRNYHAFCKPCAPAHPPLVYSSYCDKCLSAKDAGKCNHNYSSAQKQK